MVEEDLERWLEFTNRPRQHEINREEMELIARLHSIHYNHNYHVPCSCNGSIYRRWIADLNKLV
jgi:hypothetical protein